MSVTLYADIILPLSVGSSYTYSVPDDKAEGVLPGMAVIVQFGRKKLYSGVIRRLHHFKNITGPAKDILYIQDDIPVVNESQFRLWEWISSYYMCSIGEVCNAALPSGFKLESETGLIPLDKLPDADDLDEKERYLHGIVSSAKKITLQKLQKAYPERDFMNLLRSLINKGYLQKEEKIREKFKPKKLKLIKLVPETGEKAGIEKLLSALKNAKAKARILSTFLELSDADGNLSPGIEKGLLLKKQGVSAAVLNNMVKQGIFEIIEIAVPDAPPPFTHVEGPVKLNPKQGNALEGIKKSFTVNDVVLLHGVTSGGKTEIYIHLIKETVALGKQVLYLMPEIALTAQMVVRLKAVFGNRVAVYHSKYTGSERMHLWKDLLHTDRNNDEKISIILGARSAVFLPFTRLGLVIVDEEHENSYKQFDPAPRYHARDTAIILAGFHGAKVLLGTATPSVDTYYNCEKGKYGKVELNERYMDIKLPEVIVVNTRDARRKKAMHSHFSDVLIKNVAEALEKHEQVILFQNRRGYATYLECQNCGYIPVCRKCDVTLTYHKAGNRLQCHYCGQSQRLPQKCPLCGNEGLLMKGYGTEQIEDEIPLFFPGARTGRLDYDTAKKRESYETLLERFEKNEFDILVGTQMVTKGLHFDHVKVVGIMSADSLLNFPDFRSYERSFQQMAQVSGRAGRKKEQGKVIIQTADDKHPVLKYVISNDYRAFYEEQIAERRIFSYPPFSRLIRITLRHREREILDKAAGKLALSLQEFLKDKVIGPEYPMIERIKDLYQKNLLIKADKDNKLPAVKQSVKEEINALLKTPPFRSVQVITDVDPY
jgi:primosomal protein N' (replication factor Y) (superfamily II helicase)